MSHKNIAETLGISTSTVEAHLFKAFKECHAYVKARSDIADGDARFKSNKQGAQ